MLLNDFIQYTEQLIKQHALTFLWRHRTINHALQELCDALKNTRNVEVAKFSPAINYWTPVAEDMSIPTVAWSALCKQLSMEIKYTTTACDDLTQHFNEHSSLYSEEFIELWKNLLSEKNPNGKPTEDQKPKFDDLSFITDLPEATKSVAWRSPLESFHSAPHTPSSFEHPTLTNSDSEESAPIYPYFISPQNQKSIDQIQPWGGMHHSAHQNGDRFNEAPMSLNYTRASASRFNNNNDDSTLNYNFIFNVAAATLAVNCIASICVVALALTSVIALSTAAMIGVGVGLGLSTVASAAVAGYSFFKKNNTSNQNPDPYDFSISPFRVDYREPIKEMSPEYSIL